MKRSSIVQVDVPGRHLHTIARDGKIFGTQNARRAWWSPFVS